MNIHFAFTTDNSNVMQVVDQTVKAFEELSQTMRGLGVKGDVFKDIETNVKILTDSIRENEKYIEEETQKLNALAEAQKEAAAAGDTKKVLDLGVQMEDLAENIQGVINETNEYKSALTLLGGSLDDVGKKMGDNIGIMEKLVGGQEKYNEIMKVLPGPLKKVISGINGVTNAALKFLVTPLGAAIVALTIAFKALSSWLTKTAEGQEVLAKISGYVSGVMKALEQIAQDLGKALYDAFNNPKEAVKDLWKTIQEHFVNRLNGLIGVVNNFGKALFHISTLQFEKGDEDLKNIAKDLVAITTGVTSDKIKDTVNGIASVAKAESDLSVRRNKLHRDQTAWIKEEAEYEQKITEQRNKMLTGSEAERKAAAAKMQDLINEKYEKEIALATEEYNIKKASNELTGASQEDLDEEARLEAELIRLETRREKEKGASLRTERAMGEALERTAEKLREIAERREDMVRDLGEQEASEERRARALVIDAMEDGFAKEQAQLDHEHEERIEQIRRNYQKQLDTIEEMQKAEYKARHGGSTVGFVFNPNDPAAVAALHANEKALDNENTQYENEQARLEKRILESRQANRWAYLQSYGTYKEKELAITEKYDDAIAKEEDEFAKKTLGKEKEKELYELQKQYSAVFELIFADARDLTDAQLAKAIEYTREEIKKASDSGDVQKLTELYERLRAAMSEKSGRSDWGFGRILSGFKNIGNSRIWQAMADDTSTSAEDRREAQVEALREQQEGWGKIAAGINEVKETFEELAEAMESFGGTLGEIGSALSAFASQGSLIQKGFSAKSKGDAISVAVQGTLQIAEMIGSQIQQNKKFQEEWNSTVEQCAHQYMMLKLQAYEYQQRNIFGVENPYQKAIQNARLYHKSMERLVDMQNQLLGGKVQTGTKKVTNWANVGKGAGSGAAAGAAVGTILPGVGNAIGAAVGAAIGAVSGAIAGLFGGKKEVAVFESLTSRYKELFDPKTYKLSDEILADYDKLDDATKRIVDNWEDIRNEALKADEEMKATIKDLSGDVGGNLRNALVEAFKNDELYGAVNAFHDKMTDTIEDIISQMIFSELFGDLFDDLEERMTESFKGDNADNDIVDDLIWFDDAYQDRLADYKKAMDDATAAMQGLGYDVFDNDDYKEEATRGSFQGMSQQMGAALEGRFTAVQIAAQTIADRMVQSLAVLSSMGEYTANNNVLLAEIRDAHIREVGFLEDLVKQTKPIAELAGMSDKINIITSKL